MICMITHLLFVETNSKGKFHSSSCDQMWLQKINKRGGQSTFSAGWLITLWTLYLAEGCRRGSTTSSSWGWTCNCLECVWLVLLWWGPCLGSGRVLVAYWVLGLWAPLTLDSSWWPVYLIGPASGGSVPLMASWLAAPRHEYLASVLPAPGACWVM